MAFRTPDERFVDLPDYPFEPHYLTLAGDLRMHYVDEGPRDGYPVLMLHGEPTWSYLYRHMVPVFADAGYRALAPDLIGFGRSDKPEERSAHSYAHHVAWVAAWIETLDLRGITLVCQDWGSLIGLRLVGEMGDRFARVVVANGFLPTAEHRANTAFRIWRAFARNSPVFPIGRIVATGTKRSLTRQERAAYEAPFPTRASRTGPRAMPHLVPITRTTRRCRPTGPPGRPSVCGRSRSSRSSARTTRSSAGPTCRCSGTCPAPPASRTHGCRAATSSRRTRASRSPTGRWPG